MISRSSASDLRQQRDQSTSTSTSFEQRSSTNVVGGNAEPRRRETLHRGAGTPTTGATGAALDKVPVGRNMIRNSRSWRRLLSGFEGPADSAIVVVIVREC